SPYLSPCRAIQIAATLQQHRSYVAGYLQGSQRPERYPLPCAVAHMARPAEEKRRSSDEYYGVRLPNTSETKADAHLRGPCKAVYVWHMPGLAAAVAAVCTLSPPGS